MQIFHPPTVSCSLAALCSRGGGAVAVSEDSSADAGPRGARSSPEDLLTFAERKGGPGVFEVPTACVPAGTVRRPGEGMYVPSCGR
jgi:hypothetical protein